MADEPNDTEQGIIDATLDATGDQGFASKSVGKAKDYAPVYKMMPDSRIPTSKAQGKLWQNRRDASRKKLEKLGMSDNWDECIRYYKNDQSKTRNTSSADGPNYRQTRSTRVGQTSYIEAENIVFANTSALVPSLYAKNPTCDVTPNIRDNDKDEGDSQYQDLFDKARVAKRLVNALVDLKATPGVNLKPKARKAVIMTTLTNVAYIEVGYTKRSESSTEALANIQQLSDELKKAKDAKEIQEIEGKLQALEQTVDILRPSGPFVKFRHPRDVLVDPDADEADGSDAKWMMIADYVNTSFINAVYREKLGDPDNEEYKSIYQPTHIIGSGEQSLDDEINAFTIINKNDRDDYKKYGYDDEDCYRDAQRTKVWYVWDKTTRRVLMYNDSDWSWPIWVWDDPYNLDRFFPVYCLQFYTDPEDSIGPSEVMMYLDQQDAINEINGEMAKIRKRAINNIFYNKNAIRDPQVVDAYLNGTSTNQAQGVDMQPDMKMGDVFFSALPPSANYMELFKKDQIYASIDKMSSVTGVMQGQQFKTNTTNQAINTYNSQTQTRLDEKIDAVEDFIGDIMWGIMQLCLQYMDSSEVAAILGDDDAALWDEMSPDEIRRQFSIRITGGSLQKPTSQIKKAEAIQIGQVLGQYAQAGGGACLMVMLKAMERAFDDIVITQEDWKTLEQAIAQNLQRGQSTGQGTSTPEGQPQVPQGAPQPPAPQPGAGGGGMEPGASPELQQIFQHLPPQMQQAIMKALQQGVPIQEVISQVMQMVQGGAQPTQ